MISDFPDRSEHLFGREPDLVHLLDRSRLRGVTAVIGRPQMGKSWLLMELARRLALSAKPAPSPVIPSLFAPPKCLVGLFELQTDTSDFLLRAVVDLYSRWLSDSTYAQQAQATYQLQKKDLIGRTGEAVGSIFEAISKVAVPLEGVGKLVKGALEGLAAANRDLLTGATQLPRLQIDQARELLELVQKITNGQLVLIFDQWEKSLEIEKQAGILDTFVRHVEEWPSLHIFVGMRPDEKPRTAIKQLQKIFPGVVEDFDLPQMHLEDSVSRTDLLSFLRANVAAAVKLSEEDLLSAISGYPGTLAQWTSQYYAQKLHSLEDFKKVAADANANRFAEFDTLLPTLTESERQLSIRLVLLPATSNAEDWAALRTVVLKDGQGKDLDHLKRIGVIELISPPTYGHAKRTEAAFQWFTINAYEELREVCESLIFSLGGQIQEVLPRDVPFATSLISLEAISSELNLTMEAQGVCQAALTLFRSGNIAYEKLIAGVAESTGLESSHRPVAPLLAVGLLNAQNVAKKQNALGLRDALVEHLGQLFHAYPDVAVVRDQFASGLYNALVDAIEEGVPSRREALLDGLRQLRSVYPDDASVRLQLARGLFNILVAAREEKTPAQRDALLEELRQLSRAHPNDEAVREVTVSAIFNSLNAAKAENALDRRDALLEELRQFLIAYPNDSKVRQRLARALRNTSIAARDEQDLDRRDDLLEELRQLGRDHLDDVEVREQSSVAIFNTFNDAKLEQALDRRDVLLEELRKLSTAYPDDASVRELLAMALFKTLNDAKQEGTLDRRDALLAELSQLCSNYPEDTALPQWLARVLSNTLFYTTEEKAPERRDPVLADLWRLASAYPGDAAVRKELATALFYSIVQAKEENELDRRAALLDVLRHLSADHPHDAFVREQLAVALFNTFVETREEGSPDRSAAMLDELRNLYHAHPNESPVRQWLAKGLARTVGIPKQEMTLAREDALVEELRQLLRSHPEDALIRQLLEIVDT